MVVFYRNDFLLLSFVIKIFLSLLLIGIKLLNFHKLLLLILLSYHMWRHLLISMVFGNFYLF